MKTKLEKRSSGMRHILPMALEHRAQLSHSIDKYVERWRSKDPDNTVGCDSCTTAGCCRQMTMMHLFEAVPVVERLKREGRDTPELRRTLRDHAKQQRAHNRGSWFNTNTPCVFLDDNQRCTIYEDRPSACRAYYVTTDPALCDPPTTEDDGELIGTLGVIIPAAGHTLTADSIIGAKVGFAYPMHVDMLPRVVLRVLMAWDQSDWVSYVDRQPWVTPEALWSMTRGIPWSIDALADEEHDLLESRGDD